ncbi:MAG: permease-like cell division protein FtsX [Panacagrimonas sp.]
MATDTGAGRSTAIGRWLGEHRRVLILTLSQLGQRAGSSVLIGAVIGLTLALPVVLHVASQNLAQAAQGWQGTPQAALFLNAEVSAEQGQALADQLRLQDGLSEVRYVSREQALEEFKQFSGLETALSELEENPLPASILLTPQEDRSRSEVEQWIAQWEGLNEVDQVRFDRLWLERLQSALDLLRRLGLMLLILLVTATVATIANTVRLDLESRREEIRVIKMLGGSNAFVRRPFLYLGLWYGLVGSLLSLVLVQIALYWLDTPVRALAELYQTEFQLAGPDGQLLLAVVGAGLLLGLISAWWSVSRRLSRMDPR